MAERRRALCSLAVGPHAELFEITRPTFERYAIRHGYDLIVRTDTSSIGARPPAWGKLALIRELLDRYEVVVWVDADAVIVDQSTDIAARPSRRPMQLVFHEIDGVVVPNAGVLVVRRSAAAIRLLERTWHRTDYLHHRWWENAALIEVLGGDGDVGLTSARAVRRARRQVGVLDPRWNSIPPCPAPDPAIVHLAGVGHQERIEQMTDLVRQVGAAQAVVPDGPPPPHRPSWHGARVVT